MGKDDRAVVDSELRVNGVHQTGHQPGPSRRPNRSDVAIRLALDEGREHRCITQSSGTDVFSSVTLQFLADSTTWRPPGWLCQLILSAHGLTACDQPPS